MIVRVMTMRTVFLTMMCCAASAVGEREIVVFNDDGGWCWYQDERAIVQAGKLIVGSVAAGVRDPNRRGDIEATVYDLATGKRTIVELHDRLLSARGQYDDHNVSAFLVLADGRVLAVYTMHGSENRIYHRITADPANPLSWRPEKAFIPSPTSKITYSNLHRLSREKSRIYNFFRGLDNTFKPSYALSDDGGDTWMPGSVVIDVPLKVRHRPYVKYASDGKDTIHLIYTEGHPDSYRTSIYHVFYRQGRLHRSDGTPIRSLAEGLRDPAEGTRIFRGDAANIAWTSDLHLDANERPYAAYSTTTPGSGLPPQEDTTRHRYRYARWTGSKWENHAVGYAGSSLYRREEHYTGNIALDPDDPDRVYVSADVHPATGKPLISAADGKRHYEMFLGVTRNGGRNWEWTPVTKDSKADNIRPIVPKWNHKMVALLWLRGSYVAYTDYDMEVVGMVGQRSRVFP